MMCEPLTDSELKRKLEEFVEKYRSPEAVLFENIKARLESAREKHPGMAENLFHAIGFLSEEHGEAIREATKGLPGWEDRMDSELLDLIVVAARIILREYRDE
jgi:hypothetical protein